MEQNAAAGCSSRSFAPYPAGAWGLQRSLRPLDSFKGETVGRRRRKGWRREDRGQEGKGELGKLEEGRRLVIKLFSSISRPNTSS